MTFEPVNMTDEQIDEFLRTPRNAVMGTIRKDGSPQLSAIWFIMREGKLCTTIYNSSAKYYNIKRDPRVVVCVNAPHPDARSVTIFGTAELLGQESDIYDKIERDTALNYHDSAEAAEAYRASAGEGLASVVIVTATKIISQDYNNLSE